jgi:hypothetical protein
METEKIKFWVGLIEKTFIAEQDEDTIKHLDKLREMLPIRAGDEHYIIHEICGFLLLHDRVFAKKMLEMLKERII